MKQLRNVSKMLVVLVLLIGASSLFVGCPDNYEIPEKPEFTKESVTLKIVNDTGEKQIVKITGVSIMEKYELNWDDHIKFPDVLNTEIGVGAEKSFVIKDLVTKGYTSKKTINYFPRFQIWIMKNDGSWVYFKSFDSESKDQYLNGKFHIKKNSGKFDIHGVKAILTTFF